MSLKDRIEKFVQQQEGIEEDIDTMTEAQRRLASQLEDRLEESKDALADYQKQIKKAREAMRRYEQGLDALTPAEREHIKTQEDLEAAIANTKGQVDALKESIFQTKEATKAASKEQEKFTKALAKQQEAEKKTFNARLKETVKGAAGIDSAQSAFEKLSGVVTDTKFVGALKNTAIATVAVAAATKAWGLWTDSATKGAKRYMEMGKKLPHSQIDLERALEASAERQRDLTKEIAKASVRYGMAKEDVERYADAISDKLRFDPATYGSIERANGALITLTESTIQLSNVLRIGGEEVGAFIDKRRWNIPGKSEVDALNKVSTELRVLFDSAQELSDFGIFPDDLGKRALDLAGSTDSYATSLSAISVAMKEAYKNAQKMGAGYNQSVKVMEQFAHGLMNVDEGIAYLAGQRMFREANKDIDAFIARANLSAEAAQEVRDVMNDKRLNQVEKSQILQEKLGQTGVGFDAVMQEMGRYTKGGMSTSIIKDLLGVQRLEDANLIRKMIEEGDKEGASFLFEKIKKAESDAAAAIEQNDKKGVGFGTVVGGEQADAIRTATSREAGFTGMKAIMENVPWAAEIVEKLTGMANSVEGILMLAGGGYGAYKALDLLTKGRKRRGNTTEGGIPLNDSGDAVMVEMSGPRGGSRGPMSARERIGRQARRLDAERGGGGARIRNRRRGAAAEAAGAAVAASTAASLAEGAAEAFGLAGDVSDALDIAGEVLGSGEGSADAARAGAAGDRGRAGRGQPRQVRARGGARGLRARPVPTGRLANLGVTAASGAAGVGALASTPVGALASSGAAGIGTIGLGVAAAGAVGYGLGSLVDDWLDLSGKLSNAMSDSTEEIEKKGLKADVEKSGLSEDQYWKDRLRGKSSDELSKMGYSSATVDFVKRIERNRAANESVKAALEKSAEWMNTSNRTPSVPDIPMANKYEDYGPPMAAAGGAVALSNAAVQAKKNGSLVMEPGKVSSDGTLTLKVDSFYGVLEQWMDKRSMMQRWFPGLGL